MKKRLENYINLSNKRYRLMAEISKLERLQTNYAPSILNSGIGGVHGSGTSQPTENIAINNLTFFEETNAELEEKRAELNKITKELKEIEEYIERIPDQRLREVFYLRYTQGVSWANIAINFYYAPTSWWAIQKKAIDYINQHEN